MRVRAGSVRRRAEVRISCHTRPKLTRSSTSLRGKIAYHAEAEGADVFGPGTLHSHSMEVSFRITGINQPRPIASEGHQHDIESITHHLLEVAGPLDGAVDHVHAFEEPQLRPVFFLSTLALGYIHDGAHEFLELAARGEDGMHDCAKVFQRTLRRNDPELPFDACRFTDSFLERFGPPRTILRMNALAKLFERGDSLFRIEAVQAGVFIGGVGYLSGVAVQGSSACMGQPLRLGQVGFASPQLGCPLSHLHLELISGLAKLLFGPRALVDEACALKCRRSVIRGKAQKQMVNFRGKVGSIAGRGNQTALGIDTDRNDDTAAWLHAVADVRNDLRTREPAALSEMTFQPFRKRLPCPPPRDFDYARGTRIAQTNGNEIKLQQSDQSVGKSGSRFSANPCCRDSGKRYEIPEDGSQREDLSIGIAGHSVCRACALAGRPPLPDLEQQLVRRNEERVFLKQAADDNEWMC